MEDKLVVASEHAASERDQTTFDRAQMASGDGQAASGTDQTASEEDQAASDQAEDLIRRADADLLVKRGRE